MSNSLLAAALSAVTQNTVVTYNDYVEKKEGDWRQYNELDQKSLHQSHLVGGNVPTYPYPKAETCSSKADSYDNFSNDVTMSYYTDITDSIPIRSKKRNQRTLNKSPGSTEFINSN